jgi:hypothetical protein
MTGYVKITLLQNIPKNVTKLILTNHESVELLKRSVLDVEIMFEMSRTCYNRWKQYLFRIHFKIVAWYLEENMFAKAREGDHVSRIKYNSLVRVRKKYRVAVTKKIASR